MPEDLEAILARVEEELGEDARAALEDELPLDDEGNLPEDVREAMDGELKAAQKMATGGYGGAIQSEYAPGARSTRSGAGRNPVANGTAEKMDAGGSGGDPEPVDYTEEIADAFARGD